MNTLTSSASTAAAPPAGSTPADRTQQMLNAPVVATLVRLATPNIIGLFALTLTIGYDGFILGKLGADALAGIALVFRHDAALSGFACFSEQTQARGCVARRRLYRRLEDQVIRHPAEHWRAESRVPGARRVNPRGVEVPLDQVHAKSHFHILARQAICAASSPTKICRGQR